jgi:predicted AAA+ superfamily ATPase
MLKRHIEDELKDLLQEFPAVAIVGPRQVGKTTLAKQIASHLKKEVIYVDLENPRDENKLTDPVLFFENNQDKCVILDEIQRTPELFPVLRSMIDQHRVPARFILLGSASPELIRGSSETLAGRIYYLELTPIHLAELNGKENFRDLLVRGGFPNALLASSEKMSVKWREGFVKTYVERDLPLLGLPLTPNEARNLMRMMAHLQGQLINYAGMSKSLGVSAPTVKKYIYYLEHAYLVDLLEPYAQNMLKRVVKSPKIYVRDAGIINYLLGIYSFNDLLAFPNAGGIWEGFVYQQIKSILPPSVELFFYRTQHGAEIDLLLIYPDQKRIGLEIKFSSAPSLTKGNYEAMKDLNLDQLYIVIPSDENYFLNSNIEVLGLQQVVNKLLDSEIISDFQDFRTSGF